MFCSQYTMFAPAQFLRNWHERRPSNQNELDPNITEDIGRVCYTRRGRDTDWYHFRTVVRDYLWEAF